MRKLLLLTCLVAATLQAQDRETDRMARARAIAAYAGVPKARIVSQAEEERLAERAVDDAIVRCNDDDNQCTVSVGAHGEWTSVEYRVSPDGLVIRAVGGGWWLPESRKLEPLRVGGDVHAPVIVERVEPSYPLAARSARVQGIVILEIIIDRTGKVVSAQVLKPLPMGLSETSLEAVRQWRFTPGTMNGKPVDVLFNLTMNFRLQ